MLLDEILDDLQLTHKKNLAFRNRLVTYTQQAEAHSKIWAVVRVKNTICFCNVLPAQVISHQGQNI